MDRAMPSRKARGAVGTPRPTFQGRAFACFVGCVVPYRYALLSKANFNRLWVPCKFSLRQMFCR